MSSSNSCSYCSSDPESHSFYCHQSSLNQINVYKTIVAKAKLYDKPDTIIHHIEHDALLNRSLHWEWIIDMTNAKFRHYMAFNTVRQLSKWINREKTNKCKNLKRIIIIDNHPILMSPLISLGKLFLPKHVNITRK